VRKDGVPYEEAYDLTMDTLLLFRELIIAGKLRYGNLRYLFTRMARQAYLRGQKKTERTTGITESCLEFAEEEPELSREEFELLGRAFKSLGKDCRELLRAFYYRRRSLKEIASEEDRAPAAVRKQKSRCVTALRRYFYHIS
jgi:RNA polymerase sigma factor (sigma-70 family)